MRSLKVLDKEKLWERLLEGINDKLSEGFIKPIIEFVEYVSDESEIPPEPRVEPPYIRTIYVVGKNPYSQSLEADKNLN